MLHPGPLVADRAIDISVEQGCASALDGIAAADVASHSFLRAAWFAAAADGAATLVARAAGSGEPVAAIPLVLRKVGPLALREVPGSYWPYRSFPLAREVDQATLEALLTDPTARAALGRAWRLGPVLADDSTLLRLRAAAGRTGWAVLARPLGRAFVVDLAALTDQGPWPSTKTLRKNRWLERRLGEAGELDFATISGGGWTSDIFDRLAQIESASWVGRAAEARDTKFIHAASRRVWERAVADPALADRLVCSLLHIGGEPAAFTFRLRCGETVYYLANSFSERFREGSPGRVLLYRDFQEAARDGVVTIGWGAGDPGYKSEMGARPGPEIVDCLLVRGGAAAAIIRPLWCRASRR